MSSIDYLLFTLTHFSNALYLLWVSLKYFESLSQKYGNRNGAGQEKIEGWHVMHLHPDSHQLGAAH